MDVTYHNHENIKEMRQRVQFSLHKKQYTSHIRRLAKIYKQENQLEQDNELLSSNQQETQKKMKIFRIVNKSQDARQGYTFDD